MALLFSSIFLHSENNQIKKWRVRRYLIIFQFPMETKTHTHINSIHNSSIKIFAWLYHWRIHEIFPFNWPWFIIIIIMNEIVARNTYMYVSTLLVYISISTFTRVACSTNEWFIQNKLNGSYCAKMSLRFIIICLTLAYQVNVSNNWI